MKLTLAQAKTTNSSAAEIKAFLSCKEEILAVSHISPDGDAVGSLLALGGILDRLGTPSILGIDDDCPEKYEFLPGFEKILNLKKHPLLRAFNRIVILDAGALPRIGSAQSNIHFDTAILNIDHHWTSKLYGHLNYLNVEASATSELLFDICCEMKIEFTPQIAYGLYLGILSDTGRFRFTNTNARAFYICGKLVEWGVDPALVVENVYYNQSPRLVQALANGLSHLELHDKGRIGIIALDFDHYLSETDGFVEYPASVRGVAVAAFIAEMERGVFKVSLRSRSRVDVSEIARRLNGGGHRKAAGFRYYGRFEDLRLALLREIHREIERHNIQVGEPVQPLSPENGLIYNDAIENRT